MARNSSFLLVNTIVILALVTLTLCVPNSKAVLRELLAQIKADNRLPPPQIYQNSARHSSLSEQLAVLEAQQLQREEQAAAAAALLADDEQQLPLLQPQQQLQQQQQPDVAESFPAIRDSAVRRMVKLAASYLASKGEDVADDYLSSPKRAFVAASGGPGGANIWATSRPTTVGTTVAEKESINEEQIQLLRDFQRAQDWQEKFWEDIAKLAELHKEIIAYMADIANKHN